MQVTLWLFSFYCCAASVGINLSVLLLHCVGSAHCHTQCLLSGSARGLGLGLVFWEDQQREQGLDGEFRRITVEGQL